MPNLTSSEEVHNIKSIQRMNIYLKRLFDAYLSIYDTLKMIENDIFSLQNDLNFKTVDEQLIDRYNKMFLFLENQVTGILNQTIVTHNGAETPVIHPTDILKGSYTHELEIIYFLPNMATIAKPLGSVSNMSIEKINDQIELYRGNILFTFVYIDINSNITVENFRSHLDICEQTIKKLSGMVYNDVDFTKLAFRALLSVMSDAIKMSNCSKEKTKWYNLFKKVKFNIDSIFSSMTI